MRSADKIFPTTVRLDRRSVERLSNMLTENPLYTQSKLLRGAILALSVLSAEAREAMIQQAARRRWDEL